MLWEFDCDAAVHTATWAGMLLRVFAVDDEATQWQWQVHEGDRDKVDALLAHSTEPFKGSHQAKEHLMETLGEYARVSLMMNLREKAQKKINVNLYDILGNDVSNLLSRRTFCSVPDLDALLIESGFPSRGEWTCSVDKDRLVLIREVGSVKWNVAVYQLAFPGGTGGLKIFEGWEKP